MERIPEDEFDTRGAPADVYYGFNTLCASMGAALLLVGGATVAVTLWHPDHESSFFAGCFETIFGVFLLVTAAVFTLRASAGDDHGSRRRRRPSLGRRRSQMP